MTTSRPAGGNDPTARIKALYLGAKPETIDRDLQEAIALLTALPTEEQRERVAVYMDGLSQMRSEWRERPGPGGGLPPGGTRRARRRQSPGTR